MSLAKLLKLTTRTTTTTNALITDKDSEYENQVILYQPYEVEQILLPELASCLAVKAFLKMSKINYETCMRRNAEHMSPGGRFTKLPIMRCGVFVLAEFEPIVKHLTQQNTKFGGFLDADNEMDMRCYITLVENIFNMAELYVCYKKQRVYEEVTLPRISRPHPWPLNIYQNSVKRANAERLLRVYQWHKMTLADVLERVEQCCNTLNCQLELTDGPYIYGNEACALDAIVYGHIQAIVTMRLPDDDLARVVHKFVRLMEFTRFIDRKYFQS